ncbi:MAG: efflux RND transporter periplasmic adaptor subunit [Planctomycetota bacterium]
MSRMTTTLLALAVLGLTLPGCSEEKEKFEYQSTKVKKSDLRIYIRQKGEIQSSDPVSVVNPLPGRPILLSIVEEGTLVKKGDKLFDIDVNDAQDRLLQQNISTSSAEQALFKAEQDLEIEIQQNESDVKKAELDVLFAELDRKQYLEGDLPREIEEHESDIKLSEEELKRAKDTLTWSRRLAEKGYISGDKLESDELSVKRNQIQVRLNQLKKDVLDEYTSTKRKEELRSNLEEAKRELKRVQAKTAASLAQRQNEVKSRKAQYEFEVAKLEKIKNEVTNNVVYSPADGYVVYAREGGRRDAKPIEAGSQLREGQVVCTIPNMDRVKVDVDVHESWVQKVAVGMPVLITTDTGALLQGEVERIASVPDSQSWYRNPDLKVYSTEVTVENPGGVLRPGMNCAAEIILAQLEDVVNIPVQSVYSNGQKTFCYVKKSDGKAELREIEVGNHNGEMIHVKGGLEVGEDIYLALPHDAPSLPLAETVTAKVEIKPRAHPGAGEKPAGDSEAGGAGAGAENGRGGRGGRGGRQMSDEERAKMRERFNNMTPEERAKMREQMGGNRGGRGGRGGDGQGARRSTTEEGS